MRPNVRAYCEENYQNGDKVFYKRRAVNGRKGPATVLGKERNFVLIQHGSALRREVLRWTITRSLWNMKMKQSVSQ